MTPSLYLISFLRSRLLVNLWVCLLAWLCAPVLSAKVVPLSDLEIAEAKNNSGYDPRGYEHRVHGYKQQLYTDQMDTGEPIRIAKDKGSAYRKQTF